MSSVAWSDDNVNFTSLPGYYMIDGEDESFSEDNVEHQTGSGVRFTYNNYVQDTMELVFHVLKDDLAEHKALAQYAIGRTPFYISLSGAGASDSKLVTKESGYKPRELQRTKNGILYEIIYKLEQSL